MDRLSSLWKGLSASRDSIVAIVVLGGLSYLESAFNVDVPVSVWLAAFVVVIILSLSRLSWKKSDEELPLEENSGPHLIVVESIKTEKKRREIAELNEKIERMLNDGPPTARFRLVAGVAQGIGLILVGLYVKVVIAGASQYQWFFLAFGVVLAFYIPTYLRQRALFMDLGRVDKFDEYMALTSRLDELEGSSYDDPPYEEVDVGGQVELLSDEEESARYARRLDRAILEHKKWLRSLRWVAYARCLGALVVTALGVIYLGYPILVLLLGAPASAVLGRRAYAARRMSDMNSDINRSMVEFSVELDPESYDDDP